MIQSGVFCDGCDAVFAADKRHKHGVLSQLAHDAGWTSVQDGKRWSNYCPDHDEDTTGGTT